MGNRLLWLILLSMFLVQPVLAQQVTKTCFPTGSSPSCQDVTATNPFPVTGTITPTIPGVTSTNLSSTISVTSTFQSIQVSTSTRKGCLVQNTGLNTMYVFFGAIAGATTGKSVELSPTSAVSCAVGGNQVVTDQVSITGTAGDTFLANFQ